MRRGCDCCGRPSVECCDAKWRRDERGRRESGPHCKKRGSIVTEDCKSLRLTSGTRKFGPLRNKALKEAVLRSVPISCDGNMELEEFGQGVRRRYCDVQSKSKWRSAARKNIGLLGHKQDIEQ